jgi:RNA polymerase sigma-70 factor (ECF subfamily)
VADRLATLDTLWSDEVQKHTGDSCPLDDADGWLVQGLRAANEAAYEELLSRFERPVYNLVFRLLKDTDDACDVVQEVFLKVFRRIDLFRGDSTLRTWIYRIAVNEAHNHGRWHLRHRGHEIELGADEDSRAYCDNLPSDGDSPYDYVLDRERCELIEAALARLSPGFREVVVLRDMEDLSYEEIAGILDIPLGTVKSRILRGREAMRKELEKQLEREPGFDLSPQMLEWKS